MAKVVQTIDLSDLELLRKAQSTATQELHFSLPLSKLRFSYSEQLILYLKKITVGNF